MSRRLIPIISLVIASLSSEAFAVACAGVEARVNQETATLGATVQSTIASRTADLVVQMTLDRERIVSSLKALNKQMVASSDQEVVMATKATQSAALVMSEQQSAMQLANAAIEWTATGHAACDLITKGEALSAQVNDMAVQTASIMGSVINDLGTEAVLGGEPKDFSDPAVLATATQAWSARARAADDVTVQDLFDGDTSRASDFINLVIGPPVAPSSAVRGSVGFSIGDLQRQQDESRLSVVLYALSTIASDNAAGGVNSALSDIVNHWRGDDGGETWAATMAASPTRAVLLDIARIEAANIASQAHGLRSKVNEELIVATWSLARHDNRLQDRPSLSLREVR